MGNPIQDGCALRDTDTLEDVYGTSATLHDFGLTKREYAAMELMFDALVRSRVHNETFRDTLARCIVYHFYLYDRTRTVAHLLDFTAGKARVPRPLHACDLLAHLCRMDLRELVRIGW